MKLYNTLSRKVEEFNPNYLAGFYADRGDVDDSTYNSDFVPKPIEPPCPEDEEEEKNSYLKNYCC